MRKLIAVILILSLALCSCVSEKQTVKTDESISTTSLEKGEEDLSLNTENVNAAENDQVEDEEYDPEDYEYVVDFRDLDDKELLRYIKDNVYSSLISDLNNPDYYVEKVDTVFVSKEYLEEVEYNSKSNIFFGYSLEEIGEVFGDTKYVFTLGKTGNTELEPFEEYDDTFDKIIKNVAIGTGVILICVTVSAVTAGAGAPAIAMIFATSAKAGTIAAVSSGTIGGVASGIVTGIQTDDWDKALKEGALAASDGFKWGAITGAVSGGITGGIKYAKAMKALKGAELMIPKQEAAAFQMKTGCPLNTLEEIHTIEELEVYKKVGLRAEMINGKSALIKDNIDMKKVDNLGLTNLQRIKKGLAPWDPSGTEYQLHHIGQENDGTLAILTKEEHSKYYGILHGLKTSSEIDRTRFRSIKKKFWKTYAKLYEEGIIS